MKEEITLNNIVKLTIVLAILLIAGSIFYYFFLRPYQNDKPYRECIRQIDPKADFNDVKSRYANCIKLFK